MVAIRCRRLAGSLSAAALLIAAVAGCTAAPTPQQQQLAAASPVRSASPTAPAPASTPQTTPASPSTSPRTTPASSATRAPSSAAPVDAPIPAVSAQARAAGLIDIRTIVPDAVLDLRYATSNNFVGARLYPSDARCLVHQSMAAGLVTAADRLRRQGYVLVFWDCYRPHAVQVHMFQVVADPNWVARPGPLARSHEAARSVDVSLAHAATGWKCAAAQRDHNHCLLDMGTGFDDFTSRAHAFATYDVSQQAQADRTLLRTAMNASGLPVYSGEWWHFDGPGSDVGRPYLDVPVD